MPFPILSTVASIVGGYAYDKWMERSKRVELAHSLKGFGNVRGLRRDVAINAKALVQYLRFDLGLPAVIIESGRTRRRQAELYAQGRTRPGAIVTWTRESKHVYGRAFDISFAGYSADDIPESWFEDAGEAWEDIGGTWGGRWDVADLGHFEA